MKLEWNKKIYLLDGGMGTMLQGSGLEAGIPPETLSMTDPELLTSIHKQYIEAGADVVYANTFGANRLKLKGCGYEPEIVIDKALQAAKAAREQCGTDTAVALDVGPLGELLEPMGTLSFETAYDVFRQVMVQGAASGADWIVIETMTDLYEVKAAVLAAKENTDLPVFVSMSFEENGRTFTGCSIEAMAAALEGLGVTAVGINCSLGPAEILPLAEKLCRSTNLPVFVKPNAGLPDPQDNTYSIGPETFAELLWQYQELGISMVGGCCGTTPEYIRALKRVFEGVMPQVRAKREGKSVICSATKAVVLDHVTVIGERINPTGKKRMKEALLRKDFDYILSQAIEQADAGAEVLDVNTGIPDVDEVSMLPEVVKQIQAISDLPLQIDSSNAAAIEAALRVYNGKAIVNSVNGEVSVLDQILPVVKKYGAAVVGLTLDEKGIPGKAEERFAIAERILEKALSFGIPKEDVFIDCLALTASAQQAEVVETLKAITMVKEKLGLHTVLGVSNISFGLPCRPLVNRTFLALALEHGLDLPIINPNSEEMMGTVFAFELLHNRDRNAERYIARYKDAVIGTAVQPSKGTAASGTGQQTIAAAAGAESGTDLFYSLEKGLKQETVAIVAHLLESADEMTVINRHLIPALDRIGKGFEQGTIFLPQMMQAATAAQAGFDKIKETLIGSGKERVSKGRIVIATVKGDIHDIGKNIVKVILENYGYEVIDLGRDVAPETIVETVVQKEVKLLGLSALMTTTLKSMEETIAAVKAVKPDCRFMVGGAVLTAEYAEKIGADFYCKDAMKSVEAARSVLG